MVKCVSILGSTGSIGRQSLDIVKHLGLKVAALTAGTQVERMASQCREFRPELAVMATEEAAKALSQEISDLPIRVLSGEEGLLEAASIPSADCVITAVVGMVGLKPTLAAIRAGKRIGLANKETLVCAGELVMAEAEKYGCEIIPVDLKHPNWKMGPKITIDCATLMNKGLEVIEAMRLYRLPLEQVDVVIHRQSIVHSLVEFTDGAVMAQLGSPDMRLPIGSLTFQAPDMEAFPCLALARECAARGGNACAAMNGANEEAVALYLQDKIGFYDIYELVRRGVEAVPLVENPTLEEILAADALARKTVRESRTRA